MVQFNKWWRFEAVFGKSVLHVNGWKFFFVGSSGIQTNFSRTLWILFVCRSTTTPMPASEQCFAWENPKIFYGITILLMEEILHHLGCIKPCK